MDGVYLPAFPFLFSYLFLSFLGRFQLVANLIDLEKDKEA